MNLKWIFSSHLHFEISVVFLQVGGDFKKPGSFFYKFKSFGHLGFIHGFIAAVSVIIVSELGDKTFFIAAIMAMRHPRVTVFMGAMSALTVMTILSGIYF